MQSALSRRTFLGAAAAAAQTPDAHEKLRRLLEIPAPRHQVVIDTDTYNEIDDQYAVAYGILSPEHMTVEAVYAAPFHNERSSGAGDGMEKSYQEILRILKMLGRSAEGFAFRGSERFMAAAGKPVESASARDLIAKAGAPREKPLYVITIGAPTNVASAILMEPKIKEKIVVVWLGGASHEWPSAREFNLQQDIHASRVLFDSGVPLVQIPTRNVAEHLRTTLPEAERFLKGRSRLADYLFDQFVEYYRSATRGRQQPYPWSKVIWDISAVAWLIEPKWIPSRLVPSPTLTDEFTWAQKPGRHPMRVATAVNRDAIFFDLFQKIAKA
ncbi:MAG TPA: nucleoside hydrolase [Bryobacteraceae bacterium]|nr:nucleoside hydrolase [Bryobacteraceae bacterium]